MPRKYQPKKAGSYPVADEVLLLLDQHGGRETKGARNAAAKAAGTSPWTMGQLRAGKIPLTDATRAKIRAALNGNTPPRTIHGYENVPENLGKLLEKHGGFNKQAKMRVAADLGVSWKHVDNLVSSRNPMTDDLNRRVDRLIGVSPLVTTPTLIVGSLKKAPVKTRKSKFDKTDPPLIAELVAKFDGARDRAGKALGYSGAQKINDISSKKNAMDQDMEARIRAVLEGRPLPKQSDDLDRYSMQIAIVVCNSSTTFERVYEAGEAFDGDWLFKIAKGSMWIGFMRYNSVDKVRTFKRLCARDALAIVCP